jgi:hypothetical protein
MIPNAKTQDAFARLLAANAQAVGRHKLVTLIERDGVRDQVMPELRGIFKIHYVSAEITAQRLTEMGAPKTALLLKEELPKSKKARSGELGEVFATELVERRLGFEVPIRRLRWKDGREMALRGDDIIGVSKVGTAPIKILKGESKSRVALAPSVVNQAADALDRDRGRPTRHSTLFVAKRLREQGRHVLANELEEAVLQSFRGVPVEHLLFTVSGNNPEMHLNDHLSACTKKRVRHAVGVHLKNHGAFVKSVYSKI